jgi:hypothetical protein
LETVVRLLADARVSGKQVSGFQILEALFLSSEVLCITADNRLFISAIISRLNSL